MKITVVYGTERKGCTYNITQEVIKNIRDPEVTEIFLPKDLPEFCISCFRCFEEAVETCPHNKYVQPIRKKLIDAELIILTSPVYAYHMSGQLKVMLDHFANMWLVHRPEGSMFFKQGLVIATAIGPVYKKTLNEITDSLDFWGVAKTHQLGFALFEIDWSKLTPKIKSKIIKKAEKTAKRINRSDGKVKPKFRVRKWFYVMRFSNKRWGLSPIDTNYWKAQGWLDKKRPWHTK